MTDISVENVSEAMTQIANHRLGLRARTETGSHIIYATTAGKTLHIWANETGPEIGATDAIKTFIETQGNAPVVAKFVRDYNRDVVNHYPFGSDVAHDSSDGSWQLVVDPCPQEADPTARINFTVSDASE